MKNELCYINNPNSLFRKYARLVTWFANIQIGRDYLKQGNLYIPKEKIGLLLPNGYIRLGTIGKDKIEAQLVVTTHACYAPKLYPALIAIERLSRWIEDFEEAKQILLGQLDLISWGRMPASAKMLRFLTLTKYPDPSGSEVTTCDGAISRNVAAQTWAQIRTGTGSASTNATRFCAFQTDSGTPTWDFFQWSQFLYDISSIGASATITAGVNTVEFFGTNKDSTGPVAGAMSLIKCTPSSNTTLTGTDYTSQVYTRQATDIARASWSGSNAYNTFTFNTTGDTSIDGAKTGILKLGLTCSNDVDNSQPTGATGANQHDIFDGQQAEGVNKPRLVITYTIPADDIFNVNPASIQQLKFHKKINVFSY